MSGTSLNPWALVRNPLDRTKKVAENLGCSTHNTVVMVECMRNRPAHHLMWNTGTFQVCKNKVNFCCFSFYYIYLNFSPFKPFEYSPLNVFGPVVENVEYSKNPFIEQDPMTMMNDRKGWDVPWIVGVVKNEGLYPTASESCVKK